MVTVKAKEVRTGWRYRHPDYSESRHSPEFRHVSVVSDCGDRNYVHLNADCYHREQPLIVPDRDIQ